MKAFVDLLAHPLLHLILIAAIVMAIAARGLEFDVLRHEPDASFAGSASRHDPDSCLNDTGPRLTWLAQHP